MKFNLTTGLFLAFALAMIFFYAPIERDQGEVQKIFYFHVACAISMYLGLFIGFLSSILFLMDKKLLWDEISVSAIEVSYFLCTLVLLTGPIWARPIWGTWWTWEPRLTTTFLLWLLYSGYLVLRGYFGSEARGRTITSVVAVIDFLVVPLVHFSVRLWRGIHPTVLTSDGGGIAPKMQHTLVITFIAVILMFCSLFIVRLNLERTRNGLMQLRLKKGSL